jgi:FAD/FMN-containing dehydrogenase
MPRRPSSRTLEDLKAAVGRGGWLEAPQDVAPFLTDHRRLYQGATPLVLMPEKAAEVAQILRICDRDEVAVVPHGGNTSYCGAATPDEHGSQVVLSMRGLNRVRQVDAANLSMIIEAGCTLAEAQAAARDAGRLFPLSLGSAGGTAVLRYGMMRDLVLGLEVVLADGRVLQALKSLRKDNTGYDVKSLFVGAEGTLGVITAASLKLFPLPADTATALVGVDSPQHALELLAVLRTAAGDQVTSFELMPRMAVELTVRYVPGVADPKAPDTPWHLLIELTSPNPRQDLAGLLTGALEDAAAQGTIIDAIFASSGAQAQAMWKLRESIPEAQRRHGASLKHDVSVPVSAIPNLIAAGSELVRRMAPEGDVIAYGHAGDGTLHFNVSPRPGSGEDAFRARAPALELAMFDLVESLGGSISAEHGIGRLKAAEFARRADPVELSVMRALKRTLDPKGILNPGKVLD